MHEDYVAKILKEKGIEYVISLPCDRTKELCSNLEKTFKYITVPREEDGIGICSGLSLTGRSSILHMQSSGLGNSLNAIMTLPELYGLSLPILASWRGYYQEKIAAQIPFNVKIPDLLKLYGIAYTIISEFDELSHIEEIIKDTQERMRVHVGLISPKVWEGKDCESSEKPIRRDRTISLTYNKQISMPVMQRADAIDVIAGLLTDELVVSNIGVPSKELHAVRDRPENFYMLGSYTQATPIGLGMALGSGREVVVFDGDGSLLGTSILPVISTVKPDNLTIIALDNGAFGSTGNQCTPAYETVDLELMVRSVGIDKTCKVHSPKELEEAYISGKGYGPRFIHVIIRPGNTLAQNIPLSPLQIRNRFILSL